MDPEDKSAPNPQHGVHPTAPSLGSDMPSPKDHKESEATEPQAPATDHGKPTVVDHPPTDRKPFLAKVFAVSFSDVAQLIVICIVVGLLTRVGWSPEQTAGENMLDAAREIIVTIFSGLLWVLQHGWMPALIGALIVLPLWAIWRLLSYPFKNKQKKKKR